MKETTASGWARAWHVEQQSRYSSVYDVALRQRALYILRALGEPSCGAPVVYDLGCGECGVSRHLLAALPDAKLVAVDWSQAALTQAAENLDEYSDRASLVLADCADAAFLERHHGKADLVLSLGVAEHYERPGAIVEGMAPLLRPGGVLALMVPNRRSGVPISRKWLQLRGRWHVGLQREYTPVEAAKWCRDAGLRVLHAEAALREPYPADAILVKLLTRLDRLGRRVFPNWGWYTWVLAQRK